MIQEVIIYKIQLIVFVSTKSHSIFQIIRHRHIILNKNDCYSIKFDNDLSFKIINRLDCRPKSLNQSALLTISDWQFCCSKKSDKPKMLLRFDQLLHEKLCLKSMKGNFLI